MISKYKGENVEFVFLCLGVDKKEWEAVLASNGMGGSHHFSENHEEISSTMRGFRIRGIPFYALVNQEGYLTETGNHLRPMFPETMNKINALLSAQE